VNKRFILGIDRSKMRLYDVENKEQQDLVDSGQDQAVFDKTNFGSNTFMRENLKSLSTEDFKV